MVDNSAFLKRVYELYGTEEAVDLSRLLGYRSANAVRYLQRGKNPPVRMEKGEDLSSLVQTSAQAAPYLPGSAMRGVIQGVAEESDETSRALWPYMQMLRAIYEARDNPKHAHRWPALAENISALDHAVPGNEIPAPAASAPSCCAAAAHRAQVAACCSMKVRQTCGLSTQGSSILARICRPAGQVSSFPIRNASTRV